MNVLDRAIVKAYERRRQSQTAPQPANATCARDETTSAPQFRSDPVPGPLSPDATASSSIVKEEIAPTSRRVTSPDEFLAEALSTKLVELNIPDGAPPYPPYEPLTAVGQAPTAAALPEDSPTADPVDSAPVIAANATADVARHPVPEATPAATPTTPAQQLVDSLPDTIRVQTIQTAPGRVTYAPAFTRTPEPAALPTSNPKHAAPAIPAPASIPALPLPTHPIQTDRLHTYTTAEAKPVESPQLVAAAPATPTLPDRPVKQTWKWPEICEHLDQFTGDGFRQLAKHLQYAAEQGHKVLSFVSSTPGTGRTSVLMTLARILALEGKTEALMIDADRRHPHLASLTQTSPEVGLGDVLHGQIRLQQAVIPMTPGNVSLLPLLQPPTDAEWQKLVAPMRALLKQVRRDYDMILIDAGVLGVDTRLADCWLRGAVDAVITISRQLTAKQAEHEVLDWKQIGIESLGVIETFS